MNNLKNLSALNKNSNEYGLYDTLKTRMKGIKCGSSTEIEHINNYLAQLNKEHWKLLEDVQDQTGESKPHVCSESNSNCNSINKTVKSTIKAVSWKLKGFIKKNVICSNLIPRHFKLLLILKNNKDKLNDHNIDLYQHISTNFVNLLLNLKLIKYARCLDPDHPNVQIIEENENFYGGKKTKKQTSLQKLKLKHKNQLNNLKNKQKNDVLKLKSKHQKNLKKLST